MYLANELEAAEVLSGIRGAHEGIPPAGTTLHSGPGMDPLLYSPPVFGGRTGFWVEGVSDFDDPSEWSHTTIGQFIAQVGGDYAKWLARLSGAFDQTAGRIVSLLNQWPLIVKGTREDNPMRWIKTLHSGLLDDVEQFQFKIDWGKPGDDPDPTESELVDIGIDMAGKWKDALNHTYSELGTAAGTTVWAPEIKFTQLGVVLNTITDAKDKDGEGGNLSQAFETHWANINTTAGVVGTEGGPSLPYEVACAVSFHTDHAGPSGKGRLYLPAPSVHWIASNGKFVTGTALAMGKIISFYIESVKGSQDLVPVVVSMRRLILNEVKLITVGLIPDSQRRRRWAQLEAPVTAWTHA